MITPVFLDKPDEALFGRILDALAQSLAERALERIAERTK